LNTWEGRSQEHLRLCNVVLEKDGEDQLDGSREKWRSVTKSQRENKHPV